MQREHLDQLGFVTKQPSGNSSRWSFKRAPRGDDDIYHELNAFATLEVDLEAARVPPRRGRRLTV